MPRSTTGIISGITASLESDKPDLRVQRLIRDQQMEDIWRSGFDDYYRDRTQSNRNLGAFSKLWQKNYPGIMNRELGTIEGYYNGDIKAQLAALRGNERNLFEAALERGLGGVDRGLGASAVAGGFSPRSSYGMRIRDRARTDLTLQEAMRQAGQERSDFSNLEAAKVGLMGRSIPIMRASILPSELKSANYGRLAGMRAQQLATDPGIYNIWRKRGSMEMATDILDSLAQGAYKGLNAYMSFSGLGGGGMGGMGGGGGGGQSQVGTNSGPTNPYSGSMFSGTSGGSFGGGSPYSGHSGGSFGGGAPASTPPATSYSPGGNQFNDWWSSPQGGY